MRRHFGFTAKREHQWNVPFAKRHYPPSTECYTHPLVTGLFVTLYIAGCVVILFGVYLGTALLVVGKY